MVLVAASRLDILFYAALLVVMVVVIFFMVRSNKPDPKMLLWLALMKNFPKDEEDGNPERRTIDKT